ncbi:hypothetical protein [Listeria booriae]|uniref:DUF669 domain-containing protein n=1 Tax=Listeria booriae TaxID=1552123 RepID=A0A7X1CIF3_9LIST|nr:hypothetical protein [Listeria booriae]MBC1778934.1 hypothetical protein [Listeria booriae]
MKYNLSDFQSSVPEGIVLFKILEASEDCIFTKKAEEQAVIAMTLEITSPINKRLTETITSYRLFINSHDKSPFYQFLKAVSLALNSSGIDDVKELIGLGGEVDYRRVPSKNSDRTFARFSNWIIWSPPEICHQQLDHYQAEVNDWSDVDDFV